MRIPTRAFRGFLRNTSAAVTVDWVVLAALLIGLAFPLADNYFGILTEAAENVSTYISGVPIETIRP